MRFKFLTLFSILLVVGCAPVAANSESSNQEVSQDLSMLWDTVGGGSITFTVKPGPNHSYLAHVTYYDFRDTDRTFAITSGSIYTSIDRLFRGKLTIPEGDTSGYVGSWTTLTFTSSAGSKSYKLRPRGYGDSDPVFAIGNYVSDQMKP